MTSNFTHPLEKTKGKEAKLLSFETPNNGRNRKSCTCIRFTSTYGKERGIFSSPDYPRPYPSHIDCLLYTFVAAPHEIVELVFTDFEIHKEHVE
ncbi:unnamed protein product [Arctia plantaginis]|uniref:CUB domain-containing protein n=2 Tax=Arctia plantaginis TaxID=874455 RepID=A0A8S0ZRD5_ARCPL|nr:unnamed protein product [Arctia plantaginis]CAB3235892.1 unnamed protein product [Arctia plantaginis]